MNHSIVAALGRDREEYAAGYRARFSNIPDSEDSSHCWRCGWEDADTEKLESARHRQAIAEGREDDFPDTWMLLFDAGFSYLLRRHPCLFGQFWDWRQVEHVSTWNYLTAFFMNGWPLLVASAPRADSNSLASTVMACA